MSNSVEIPRISSSDAMLFPENPNPRNPSKNSRHLDRRHKPSLLKTFSNFAQGIKDFYDKHFERIWMLIICTLGLSILITLSVVLSIYIPPQYEPPSFSPFLYESTFNDNNTNRQPGVFLNEWLYSRYILTDQCIPSVSSIGTYEMYKCTNFTTTYFGSCSDSNCFTCQYQIVYENGVMYTRGNEMINLQCGGILPSLNGTFNYSISTYNLLNENCSGTPLSILYFGGACDHSESLLRNFVSQTQYLSMEGLMSITTYFNSTECGITTAAGSYTQKFPVDTCLYSSEYKFMVKYENFNSTT